jgi:hypothetical protein
MITKQ